MKPRRRHVRDALPARAPDHLRGGHKERDRYFAECNKAPPLAAAPTPPQVYAAWAQALGSWGSLKGDGNSAQTDQSLGGIVSGVDVTFDGRWRAGVAGGYSHSSFKSASIAASGSSESYHVALYGGGQVGAWGLRGGASYSWHDVGTSRQNAEVNLVGLQRRWGSRSRLKCFWQHYSWQLASG